MKQYISILAALFLCFSASTLKAQIVNIPDANFKNYILNNTGIDANNDSEVQVSEAQSMGDLNIRNQSISDLTGIEEFINITELKCDNNLLTPLDLSANTLLEEVYCSNNQLTSFNISTATALIILDCSDNQLTSLDVSNKLLLEELYANNNQLVTINVTGCITLLEANCSDNSLNTLDVSTCNFLHTFNCSFNASLQALDFSANDSLKNIDCSNCDLHSLDMRSPAYPSLLNFNALTNPSLCCIEVLDTTYATANWANVDPVANFSLINCASIVNIPDVNFKAYLVGSAAINKNLDTEIQLSEALGFAGLIDIFNLGISDLTGIESFKNLKRLHAGLNQLTTIDLSKNTKLEEFHGFSNQFTSLDISNNLNLRELWCFRNQLTSLDVSNNLNLKNLITSFNQLTSLDLSNNPDLITLTTGFNPLTSLDISSNPNIVNFNCRDAMLTSLNLKNGNNVNFTLLDSSMINNPNLTCIEVDDSTYSTNNWGTYIDATASFSGNCFYLGTSELEQHNSSIQAYPNPTKNTLTIDLGTVHSSVNITISNTIGQKVQSVNYSNAQILDLNIEGLPGWYFIQIETEDRSKTIKVLKQ